MPLRATGLPGRRTRVSPMLSRRRTIPTSSRSPSRVLWQVAALTIALSLLTPLGASASDHAVLESVDLITLSERVSVLEAELTSLDTSLDDVGARLVQAERSLIDAERGAHAAEQAEARTAATLSDVAVASYLSGGRVPDALVAEVLGAERHTSTTAAKLVLAEAVHHAVIDRHHRAVVELRTRHDALESARHDHAELVGIEAQVDTAHRDHTAELEAARTALDTAHLEALGAALLLAEREAELRAGIPPAQPVATGVVPPPTVPADVAGALGGHIPFTALDAYWRAAALTNAQVPGCGIDWALIAGIGLAESRHGTYSGGAPRPDGTVFPVIIGIALDGSRGTARILDTDGGLYDGDPVYDRAVGPMQFIPSTWVGYAYDGNGDGVADPHNIYDAAFAAGVYLCRNAGGVPITDSEAARRAVHGYNRSWTYVTTVLATAATYRAMSPSNVATVTELVEVTETPTVLVAPGTPTTTTTAPVSSTEPSTSPPSSVVEEIDDGEIAAEDTSSP